MSKEVAKFSCGHTEEVSLFGPYKERARKLEYMESQLCSACYKAEREAAFEAKKQAEAEKASAIEASIELPELLGSEKQVSWARAIRAKSIEALEAMANATEANLGAEDPRMAALRVAIAGIKAQAEAKFWIEHREATAKELIKEFIKL